jgi:hypothetical protein
MATKYAIISAKLVDAVGVVKAYEEYVSYDDATATLATLTTAVNSRITALDAVTDAQILAVSLKLSIDVVGGAKAAPVANSDVEETGLFTFITSAPGGKAYSQDVPAIKPALLNGRTIITSSGAGQSYYTTLTGTGGTLRNTDNKWAYTLDSLRTAQKTFRKSRRALKRA